MKKNVCILIRVYNRIEDLKYCVDIIRDTWVLNDYYLMIVFNGGEAGFTIDPSTVAKADKVISIKNNTGHFSGNSQLLLEGLPHIPSDCKFTVILEADTWLHGDELIDKYIAKLEVQDAVWASAQFFRYIQNLATDIAIVKTDFVKANPELFKFDQTPEYYVANYLEEHGRNFVYIKELMPVNLPRYIKRFPFAPTGRFFMFPAGKMVTHHIESLKRGMDEKKFYFNVVAGTPYFNVKPSASPALVRLLLKLSVALTVFIPYKSWFISRKKS